MEDQENDKAITEEVQDDVVKDTIEDKPAKPQSGIKFPQKGGIPNFKPKFGNNKSFNSKPLRRNTGRGR